MNKLRIFSLDWVKNILFAVLGIVLALAVGEVIIRISTLDQNNYVIEMWRYAKLLKEPSPNPNIGHQHIPNQSATLQNVDIDINSLGMRGPMPRFTAKHRVAIIGDSLALGWGVPEPLTLRGQLAERLGEDFDVVNAGIGNMNVKQAVERWAELRIQAKADYLVVFVSPRATAKIDSRPPGWLIKNSQLAALGSTFALQLISGEFGEQALIEGYRNQWNSEFGQNVLRDAFDKLKKMSKLDHAKVIIVSIPEMHDFSEYKFGFMEDITKQFAKEYKFGFVDVLPLFGDRPTSDYWVSNNDIHLNEYAFQLIVKEIISELSEKH